MFVIEQSGQSMAWSSIPSDNLPPPIQPKINTSAKSFDLIDVLMEFHNARVLFKCSYCQVW